MDSIKMARLDFLTIKSNVAPFAIMTLLMIVLLSFVFDTFFIVGFGCAWTISMTGMFTFQAQENSSLETLYGSVPLSIKDIVIGRHFSTFVLFVVFLLFGVIVFVIVCAIKGSVPQIADIVSGISLALLIYAILAGVTTPLLFKMGFMKGRIISNILFFVIMGLPLLASYLLGFTFIVEAASQLSNYLVPICIITSTAILALSYRLSVIAYRKRK